MRFKFEKKYLLTGLMAFFVLAGVLLLYYIVFHGTNIKNGVNYLLMVSRPIVYGFVLAYIMTPMLNFIEKKWLNKIISKIKQGKEIQYKKQIRFVSILLTSLLFVLIIYVMISMLVSQIVPSIRNIVNNFDSYVNNLTIWVNKLFEDNRTLAIYAQDLINTYLGEFESWLSSVVIPQTSVIIKSLSLSVLSMLGVLWNFIIGFVISIYLLGSKEILAGQSKKIVYAIFKTPIANAVIRELRYVNQTFIGFIIGKIIDSIIIGILCFIGTTIIGTPYPALVSLIIGVTNVIPFFGPYIGAVPCAIFVLIVDFTNPMNCLYFVLFILVLQQFDGNILGPKILGDSTGLSGFWVIFSITLFGGLFGIFGMIIGVPIFAVIFNAVKRTVNYRLKKKELPTETTLYLRVGSIEEDAEFTEYITPQNKNKVFNKKVTTKEDESEISTSRDRLFKKYYRNNQENKEDK